MTDFLCAATISERGVNACWKLLSLSPVPSFQLDLKLKTKEGGDISGYTTNGEWALIGTVTKRKSSFYVVRTTSCPNLLLSVSSLKQWLSF